MRAKEFIRKFIADIRLQACLLQKELYEKNNAMQTAEPEEFQTQASTGALGQWEECLGFSAYGNQKKSLTLHLESLLVQALRGKKWRKLKKKLLWQTAIL